MMRRLHEAAAFESTLRKRSPHFYGGHVLCEGTGRARTIGRLAATDESGEFELRREALLPGRKPAVMIAAADPVDAEGITGDAVADRRVVGGAVGAGGGEVQKSREHERCELEMIHVVLRLFERER